MSSTNWRSVIMFCLMFGLMVIVGMGYIFLAFAYNGESSSQWGLDGWWTGMWGIWGIGRMLMGFLGMAFVVLFIMVCFRFFFGGMDRRDWFWGWCRPWGWMSDHDTCQECGYPLRAHWKLCPRCGLEIHDRDLA